MDYDTMTKNDLEFAIEKCQKQLAERFPESIEIRKLGTAENASHLNRIADQIRDFAATLQPHERVQIRTLTANDATVDGFKIVKIA